MEAKLLRIKLKADARPKADALLSKMRRDIALAHDEMAQKGYFWDCVFLAEVGDDTYLYIVGKSKDWSATLGEVPRPTPFREYYDQFVAEAWAEHDIVDAAWTLNQALDIPH